MTRIRFRRMAAPFLCAAAVLLLAGAAHAQIAPDLNEVHDALHLNTTQEAAWSAFAAASSSDPQQQARERSARQLLPTLRSPQRVDLMIAAAEADLDTLKQRSEALKTFYAQLSAGQQAIFDRETLPPRDDEDR